MKVERYNANAYRIIDASGAIIGFALRLATGKWIAADTNDKRIKGTPIYGKPSDVAKDWNA